MSGRVQGVGMVVSFGYGCRGVSCFPGVAGNPSGRQGGTHCTSELGGCSSRSDKQVVARVGFVRKMG
jgi:hypothetical protein